METIHKPKLILFGTGGHAFSTFDSVTDYEVAGFIDELCTGKFLGKPIYNSIEEVPNHRSLFYHIAVGDCELRKHFYTKCKDAGARLVNIIHPSACVSKYAVLGEGNFIGRFATVGVDVKIGDNNLLNSGCIVEHGCRIGNHNNICPQAVLNGDEIVDDLCFIGSNSVLKGDLHIGSNSVVGCGAVCVKNVECGTTVVGNPARPINR